MKKIIILAICCFIGFGAFAQTEKKMDKMEHMDKMKDCIMKKDGKVMQMKDGKTMELTETATLSNGTMVMADGSIKMKDGKMSMLKEGESIDMDGKMKMMKKKKME